MKRRGLPAVLLFPLALAFAATACVPPDELPASSLVLKDVILRDPARALDGNPGAAPGDAPVTVVVEDGRIAGIGPRTPPGGTAIDADGAYLLPGLWDLHTHLDGAGDAYPRLLVAHGVTGVRDLGGDLDRLLALRGRIERGELPGPRIVLAGPTLNGVAAAPHHRAIASPQEARAAVVELQAAGVDLLKTHNATARETYFALLEATREAGLEVAGHVPVAISPLEACRAGQSSVEHIATILEGTYLAAFDNQVDALHAMPAWLDTGAAELIDCFAERRTLFVPTLSTYAMRAHWAEWFDDPDPLFALLGEDVRRTWLDAAPTARDRDPRVIELRDQLVRAGQGLASQLQGAGAPLGTGTDIGIGGRGLIPGKSLHRELALLAEAGLSPAAVLRAATRGPGEGVTGDPTVGRLVVGAPADLVLVGGDPFASLDALDRIEAVVAAGRVLDRDALARLLDRKAGMMRE